MQRNVFFLFCRKQASKMNKMERRASTNSDSSTEPMDISVKTTSSTDPNNSSLALRHTANSDPNDDSDNMESDDNMEYKQKIMRRDNLRQLDANMIMRKKFRHNSMPNKNSNNNNNNNSNRLVIDGTYVLIQEHLARLRQSVIDHRDDTTSSIQLTDSNENFNHDLKSVAMTMTTPPATPNNNNNITNNNNIGKYNCPICDAVSVTQHEFTEHIRSHNSSDDTNFTCKICYKVSVILTKVSNILLCFCYNRILTPFLL